MKYKAYYKNKIFHTDFENNITYGELHREDGPALIRYDNNITMIEYYYQNGKLHNDNGPAYIQYDYNNITMIEYYYQNGKCHREDGPAIIFYHNNKNLEVKYFLMQYYYDSYDEWKFIVDNKMGRITQQEWPDDFKTMYELKFS